jgi:hypothetical protein
MQWREGRGVLSHPERGLPTEGSWLPLDEPRFFSRQGSFRMTPPSPLRVACLCVIYFFSSRKIARNKSHVSTRYANK